MPILAVEIAYQIEKLTSKGHIGADGVADRLNGFRHAAVGAANDPVKFFWEPGRLTPHPQWRYLAASTQYQRIGISCAENQQPIRPCHRVVIKKGHTFAPPR